MCFKVHWLQVLLLDTLKVRFLLMLIMRLQLIHLEMLMLHALILLERVSKYCTLGKMMPLNMLDFKPLSTCVIFLLVPLMSIIL